MKKHRARDRKILSSIVEVMEVSKCEEDFHVSDGNLSEDGQVEVNACGSPIAALDTVQDIVRGGEALVVMKTLFTWRKVQRGFVLFQEFLSLIFCFLE